MSPPLNNDYGLNRNRLILHHLFEEIEQHVIEEHTPREISNAFYPSAERTVSHYSFRGLSYYADSASLGFVISCSCGRRWQISLIEFRTYMSSSPGDVDSYMILEEFCRRMSDRYVTETEYRTYNHYMPEPAYPAYPNKEEKPKKSKKSKEDKPIVFDNAIEGLEI